MAKELGINPTAMYRYFNGHRIMDDFVASQVAELLGINEMEVIAQCNLERSKKTEEKSYWKKKLQQLAACVLVTVATIYGGITAGSSTTEEDKNAVFFANSMVLALFLYLYYFA